MLTARPRWGQGRGRTTSRRPWGHPPRPPRALRGLPLLFVCFPALPVSTALGLGVRLKLLLLTQSATLGQVPSRGGPSLWFSPLKWAIEVPVRSV